MISRDRARETYRAHNMRVTPQRLAVVDELIGDTTHPTAEDVAGRVKAKMEGVSLSTVYKTLNELVELGLIKRVEGKGAGNEAAHFDPNVVTHGHLHCRQCGRIVDLELTKNCLVDSAELEKEHAVRIENIEIEANGICSNCIEEEK